MKEFNNIEEMKEYYDKEKNLFYRDIVLKKGDIIYYADNSFDIVTYTGKYYWRDKIIKIERPVKYETIYEAPKQILDKEEKEYLEAVCRPFKDRVKVIKKCSFLKEYILIIVDNDYIIFPYFEKGTMYKGMEIYKEYTLKELGLFEE